MRGLLLAGFVLLAAACEDTQQETARDSTAGRTGVTAGQSPAAVTPAPTPSSSPTPPPTPTAVARLPEHDALRPPLSWQGQAGTRPSVSELYIGRKPDGPWIFKPRKDLPAWDTSIPIRWAADPFQDISWQHRLHAWSNMDYWLHEYEREGDPSHLSAPVEIALDWHRFHIEEGRTSAFQWYDHSTGVRASRLAFLLDFILSDRLEVTDADLAPADDPGGPSRQQTHGA